MELNNLTPLCRMAYQYKTDKCPQIHHSYTPFYYKLLKDKRKSIKKVLEVGIGYQKMIRHIKDYQIGASLFMWRDFFPNAQIYGADIIPKTIFKDERIETFLCDETKEEDLKELVKKVGLDIDLFIDDGSHKSRHQIFMCQTLMPLLNKNVIYIIEDVIRPEKIADALSVYNCQIVSFDHNKKGDNIIIVKKYE